MLRHRLYLKTLSSCIQIGMHIAIDDTYGPVDVEPSAYVTGRRRTFVGVLFQDEEVEEIRSNIRGCLGALPNLLGISVPEFHFVEVYNRKGAWADAPKGANLDLFEFFANIYSQYRWQTHVQTVDDRTGVDRYFPKEVVDGIDLRTREGQALMVLLLKIRRQLCSKTEPIVLRIDEGKNRPGVEFATSIFADWNYDGMYASSTDEPLIQIADFLAFSINRTTHLGLKEERSETDRWFLNLVGRMRINSADLRPSAMPIDFSRDDFDAMHAADRREKRLE